MNAAKRIVTVTDLKKKKIMVAVLFTSVLKDLVLNL